MNLESISSDLFVIIASGLLFQIIKQFCRGVIYPLLGKSIFKLEYDTNSNWHFSKQCWKLSWHSLMFIFELSLLLQSDFWTSVITPYNEHNGTSLIWSNVSKPPTFGVRLLYLLQIGFYVFDLIFMHFIDKHGINDKWTMTGHHFAALSLLIMSYSPAECWKIGCAVLFLHEIGDVILTLSKSMHYAQFKMTSTVLFVVNILIWSWSRLVLYPRIILSVHFDLDAVRRANIWQCVPCTLLLWVLFFLNIYWIFLMLKVLITTILKKKKLEDPRDKTVEKVHVT